MFGSKLSTTTRLRKATETSFREVGAMRKGLSSRKGSHLDLWVRAFIVGSIACLVVACGAAATASPASATPSRVVTPVPTVAPTPDLFATAAIAYLAAANTINASNALAAKTPSCKTQGGHYTSTAAAKACWAQYSAADKIFLSAIYAISYPPSMKADTDAQITAMTKEATDDDELAFDPTTPGLVATENADSTAESATANIVRHDLGLPQVST
jgi:hypothetical protein